MTSLTILGTKLDQRGTTFTSYHHRKDRAENVFWKYYRQAKHKKANQATKIDTVVNKKCGKSVFNDSGNWDITIELEPVFFGFVPFAVGRGWGGGRSNKQKPRPRFKNEYFFHKNSSCS